MPGVSTESFTTMINRSRIAFMNHGITRQRTESSLFCADIGTH